MNNTRVSALIAVPVTAIAVLYAAACAAFSWEPSLGWLIQALIHIGELAGVVALGPHGLRPVAVAMFIAAGVMLVASGVLSRLLKTLAAPDSFEAPPFLFSKAYLVEWRRRRQAKRELAASPFGR